MLIRELNQSDPNTCLAIMDEGCFGIGKEKQFRGIGHRPQKGLCIGLISSNPAVEDDKKGGRERFILSRPPFNLHIMQVMQIETCSMKPYLSRTGYGIDDVFHF